jgi:hypothetical protein
LSELEDVEGGKAMEKVVEARRERRRSVVDAVVLARIY